MRITVKTTADDYRRALALSVEEKKAVAHSCNHERGKRDSRRADRRRDKARMRREEW